MARLIGTAGHVDHGKTSLIQALTGIDTDRLPEEKKRGLTIDIGFAHIQIPGIGQVSIVDVPGHERFLSNMLVGALGVDVAVLCIAADESVMPQTREHLQILTLLPVRGLVVALTRVDLVDDETLAVSRLEAEELLASTRFVGSPVVPVSAHTGRGLDELREHLAESLKAAQAQSSGPWYLPIDRVFTIKGHGAVVTGTLMRGQVATGEEAIVEPGRHKVRIRKIQGHDADRESAERGQRTAFNLGGVRAEDVQRGMVVGQPGAVFATTAVDVQMQWTAAPKNGTRVRVSIGADEVIGRVKLAKADPNRCEIRFERETAAVAGQPIIVRRYSPPDLLGGGSVASPILGGAAAVIDQTDLPTAILQALGQSGGPLTTDQICQSLGKTTQALGNSFEDLLADKRVVGHKGLWFRPEQFESAAQQLVAALEGLYARSAGKLLFPKEQVAKAAGVVWPPASYDRVLTTLDAKGDLVVRGSQVGLPGRASALTPAQRALLNGILKFLDSHGANVPNPAACALHLRVPVQAVEAVLRLGADTGEAVRLDESVWYSRGTLDQIVETARAALGARAFSASDFRDSLQTSRKYAIPILEHLDAKGITYRRGDERVFN